MIIYLRVGESFDWFDNYGPLYYEFIVLPFGLNSFWETRLSWILDEDIDVSKGFYLLTLTLFIVMYDESLASKLGANDLALFYAYKRC